MVLNVDAVSFSYKTGTPVLMNVGFQIAPNEIVALVGPNGSGKSTLIKLVVDLLHLRDGSVRVGGFENSSRGAKMRSMYVASNDYVPEFLTGYEYLRFVSSLYGEKIQRDAAIEIFARYQMAGRQDDLIEDYSHGMRKKLQLITALLLKRELTIIDETLNGIDLDAIYTFEKDVVSLAQDGRSVVLCSHDFPLLQRVAKRLLFLAHGFLVDDVEMTQVTEEMGSIDSLVREYLKGTTDETP
jgi:ABC-2 type transport system ATP-binding protein